MPITIEDLTVNFEHVDRAALLADWEWLIGPNRLPILISFIECSLRSVMAILLQALFEICAEHSVLIRVQSCFG